MEILKKIEFDVLGDEEIHPVVKTIPIFLNTIPYGKLIEIGTILKVNALQGNKNAMACKFALDKFLKNEDLTDTHLLGLAWTVLLILKEQRLEEVGSKINEIIPKEEDTKCQE